MIRDKKISVLFLVLVFLVTVLVGGLLLFWFFNYTVDGMTQGMILKGYVYGGQFWVGDSVNITNVNYGDYFVEYRNFNTSGLDVEYLDSLSKFLELNDDLSCDRFRCGFVHGNERFVIFNSVHYSDSFPFFDWWFCDGLKVYVWNNWVGSS